MWQVPHATPFADFTKRPFPRSACSVMGLLCPYTRTTPATITKEIVNSRRIVHLLPGFEFLVCNVRPNDPFSQSQQQPSQTNIQIICTAPKLLLAPRL